MRLTLLLLIGALYVTSSYALLHEDEDADVQAEAVSDLTTEATAFEEDQTTENSNKPEVDRVIALLKLADQGAAHGNEGDRETRAFFGGGYCCGGGYGRGGYGRGYGRGYGYGRGGGCGGGCGGRGWGKYGR